MDIDKFKILEKSNKHCVICDKIIYKNEDFIGTITKQRMYEKSYLVAHRKCLYKK